LSRLSITIYDNKDPSLNSLEQAVDISREKTFIEMLDTTLVTHFNNAVDDMVIFHKSNKKMKYEPKNRKEGDGKAYNRVQEKLKLAMEDYCTFLEMLQKKYLVSREAIDFLTSRSSGSFKYEKAETELLWEKHFYLQDFMRFIAKNPGAIASLKKHIDSKIDTKTLQMIIAITSSIRKPYLPILFSWLQEKKI